MQQDQRVERVTRCGDPVRRIDAEPSDHLIDDSGFAEQLAPHDGDRDAAAEERRQVVDAPEEPEPPDLLVEKHRHQESEHQLQGNAEGDVGERDAKRSEIARVVGEQVDVVGQSDPARAPEQIEVGERKVQRSAKRTRGEDEEPGEPGKEEEVGLILLTWFPPADVGNREACGEAG